MVFNHEIHHRRSIRLKDYDYARAGAYFITLCSFQRECLFGEVVGGEMALSEFGAVLLEEWNRTPEIRREIDVDACIVMPNHFHGIIVIDDVDIVGRATGIGGATSQSPLQQSGPRPRSLGALVGGFKAATTEGINLLRGNSGRPVWQRNFFERVIRDEKELASIRQYIGDNPIKWASDRENPMNHP